MVDRSDPLGRSLVFRGLAQSQAEQARRRLQRDGGKRPTLVRDLQCGLNLSVRKPSVCGASDRRCVTLASCVPAIRRDCPRTGGDFGGRRRSAAGQRPAQVEPGWDVCEQASDHMWFTPRLEKPPADRGHLVASRDGRHLREALASRARNPAFGLTRTSVGGRSADEQCARKTRERPGGPRRSTTGSLRVSSSQRLSEISA